jgi:phosphoglycolate phosphatase-like HAD superfamily hydrolase
LLNWLAIAERFEAVFGPEDVARPKPYPDMLLEALCRFAVPAAEALYVGDMVVDIQTARAAGVQVWVVPSGSDTREDLIAAGPDRVLRSIGDLTRLLVGTR